MQSVCRGAEGALCAQDGACHSNVAADDPASIILRLIERILLEFPLVLAAATGGKTDSKSRYTINLSRECRDGGFVQRGIAGLYFAAIAFGSVGAGRREAVHRGKFASSPSDAGAYDSGWRILKLGRHARDRIARRIDLRKVFSADPHVPGAFVATIRKYGALRPHSVGGESSSHAALYLQSCVDMNRRRL